MELFNSYLNKQLILNNVTNQFTSKQFLRTDRNPFGGGGGLGKGSGLNSGSVGGLNKEVFEKRQQGVKKEMTSKVEQSDEKSIKVEQSDEKSQPPPESATEKTESASDDIILSGTISGKKVKNEKVQEEVDLEKEAAKVETESTKQVTGFTKLITAYGEPFKNSRSRKSVVFVPTDKSKPLYGWKSLSKAKMSSKRIGKITSNGQSVKYTWNGLQGNAYFLSTAAWKDINKKKRIFGETEEAEQKVE
jgi:hypothetical protein